MKYQIRNGLFETNSSSVHTLVIGHHGQDIFANLPKRVDFKLDWQYCYCNVEDPIQYKANYLYRAIAFDYHPSDSIKQIKEYLDKYNIEYTFENPLESEDFDFRDGSNGPTEFVDIILQDETTFMYFLFSEDTDVDIVDNNWYPDHKDDNLPPVVIARGAEDD
jgi:hypothetical protein